jgi:hypothetical protein
LINFFGESFNKIKICLYSLLSNIFFKLNWNFKSISYFRDIIESLLSLDKFFLMFFKLESFLLIWFSCLLLK